MERLKSGHFDAYLFIYRTRIQKTLAYKFDVFANIIFQSIVMFATAFFWKALYSGYDTVQGISVREMLTYTVISSLMSIFLTTNVEQRVIASVREGTVAMDMLKPIRLFGIYLAEDLGNITSLFFQNALPIFIIGSICIAVPVPAGGQNFALFLLSFLMAFIINWLLAAIFSMWAFTAINMDPMVQVKKHLIRLLSGSIIPMWFFPHWLKSILEFLPFTYIYQLPLDIYIGKSPVMEFYPRLCIQLFWTVLLFIVFSILQKRVLKKVMVQGG